MDEKDQKIIREILKKNDLSNLEKITRFTSGQINRAYNIGGKYVIKIEGDLELAHNILKHQPKLIERLLKEGARVPRIIDYGDIDGKNYLLMEKLPGEGLANIWYQLNLRQKENFISQIVDQLKIFHSIHFDKFTISGEVGKKYKNWIDAVKDVSDFSLINKEMLDERTRGDVEFIESFFKEKINILNDVNESVLVHQDVHFENIFHDGDELTGIIDFDWSCQAPKEYDLWILADYFHAPWYYVEKDLEKFYQFQMIDEMKMLRKYYPELFQVDNLLDKVRLYYATSLIDWVADYQKGRWSKNVLDKVNSKINDFYRNDWLENSLSK